MARPRIPSEILELRGAYKHDPQRRRVNEPNFENGDVYCPKYLSAGAKVEWKRIYPILRAARVMSPAYLGALAGYCHYYAQWADAVQKIGEFGVIVRDPGNGNPIRSPYAAIADQASAEYRAWAVQLGLTAVSKTRAASGIKEKENKFDRFTVIKKQA